MKFEELHRIVIKEILSVETGKAIPSINGLADKFDCSRGNIQKSITMLETKKCIKLEKTNQGSILLDLDLNRMRKELFDSKVNIVLPNCLLEDESNLSLFFQVRKEFDLELTNLYTAFMSSASERYNMLQTDSVELALLTNTYFDLLDDQSIEVVKSFSLSDVEKYAYTISEKENTKYIEELSVYDMDKSNKLVNSQYKLLTPDNYVAVCKKDISKLLK